MIRDVFDQFAWCLVRSSCMNEASVTMHLLYSMYLPGPPSPFDFALFPPLSLRGVSFASGPQVRSAPTMYEWARAGFPGSTPLPLTPAPSAPARPARPSRPPARGRGNGGVGGGGRCEGVVGAAYLRKSTNASGSRSATAGRSGAPAKHERQPLTPHILEPPPPPQSAQV